MERNNEDKLELLADLLAPVSSIFADNEVIDPIRNGEPWIGVISTAIRNHKTELIEIMARVDGVEPKDYEVNLIALPVRLLNFVNRPEVQELFTGQGQRIDKESSGSAMGNTEDGAK